MTVMLKVRPIWKKNQRENAPMLLWSQSWMMLLVLTVKHRDDNEAANKVDNQLPIEQPNKLQFKNHDEVLNKDKY